MEKTSFITIDSIDTINKGLLQTNIKAPIDCIVISNKLRELLWNCNNKTKILNKKLNIISYLINLTSNISNNFEEDEIYNIINGNEDIENFINTILICANDIGEDDENDKDDENINNNITIDGNQINALLYDRTMCNLTFDILNGKFMQFKNDDVANNNKKNTIYNLLEIIKEIHTENKSNGVYWWII